MEQLGHLYVEQLGLLYMELLGLLYMELLGLLYIEQWGLLYTELLGLLYMELLGLFTVQRTVGAPIHGTVTNKSGCLACTSLACRSSTSLDRCSREVRELLTTATSLTPRDTTASSTACTTTDEGVADHHHLSHTQVHHSI